MRSRQAWALVSYTLGVEGFQQWQGSHLFKDGAEGLHCSGKLSILRPGRMFLSLSKPNEGAESRKLLLMADLFFGLC